ncbi:MAG: hypothetical protein ACAI38_15395 [Myxococcota bacterium]|nr:hypothetical protein [Myxococcota bacterium]
MSSGRVGSFLLMVVAHAVPFIATRLRFRPAQVLEGTWTEPKAIENS